MPEEHTLTITLDEVDWRSVQKAIAIREATIPLPDADGGDLNGRVIAEICRGWLDFIDWHEANGTGKEGWE